jgi:hypothetical protein
LGGDNGRIADLPFGAARPAAFGVIRQTERRSGTAQVGRQVPEPDGLHLITEPERLVMPHRVEV